MYWITLYDSNGLEKWTRHYDTKAEQMGAYYALRVAGYRASDIEKGKYR